jgi:hypothetical protein
MTGVELIAAERQRQVEAEGWTTEHDDGHYYGELAQAAACYARFDVSRAATWPWAVEWWKPTPGNRVRELVKAGALIAAEIDRLQRAADGPAGEREPCAKCGGSGEIICDFDGLPETCSCRVRSAALPSRADAPTRRGAARERSER